MSDLAKNEGNFKQLSESLDAGIIIERETTPMERRVSNPIGDTGGHIQNKKETYKTKITIDKLKNVSECQSVLDSAAVSGEGPIPSANGLQRGIYDIDAIISGSINLNLDSNMRLFENQNMRAEPGEIRVGRAPSTIHVAHQPKMLKLERDILVETGGIIEIRHLPQEYEQIEPYLLVGEDTLESVLSEKMKNAVSVMRDLKPPLQLVPEVKFLRKSPSERPFEYIDPN